VTEQNITENYGQSQKTSKPISYKTDQSGTTVTIPSAVNDSNTAKELTQNY